MDRRCKATTASGQPCSAQPIREDGFCYWHSPATAEERIEARRRGGKARSNRERARKQLANDVRDLSDVQSLLMAALKKVEEGKLEPAIGNCMATLARSIASIAQATGLEERVAALEKQLDLRRLA